MGLAVPLWLLGSSLYSAQLAANLGLPFAFASHFAPASMISAIDLYRRRFTPSATLEKPYVMLALNVVAADDDAEARRLFTSLEQAFLNLRRNTPGQLPAPVADFDRLISARERLGLDEALECSVVGSPATVAAGIERFAVRHGADELMLTGAIYDHAARLRSFEIVADVLLRQALTA
jgi:luciferase family oxidoreductase group 1